jgi:hypothetical protein
MPEFDRDENYIPPEAMPDEIEITLTPEVWKEMGLTGSEHGMSFYRRAVLYYAPLWKGLHDALQAGETVKVKAYRQKS